MISACKQSLHGHFWWIGPIGVEALDELLIGSGIGDDEAVAGGVGFVGGDLPVAVLAGAIAEEGNVGIQAHALRGAEIAGVIEDGDAGHLAVGLAGNVAPAALG